MKETKKIELLEQEIIRLNKIIVDKDTTIEQIKSTDWKSKELKEIETQKFELLDNTISKYNAKMLELEEQLNECKKLEIEYFELVSELKDIQEEITIQKSKN